VSTATFTRAVTVFAVGFLTLDAALFALVNRFLWAAVCVVAAVLVVVGWRRYRRAMTELADARKEMKREVESIRDLLHTHRQN
jgi:beta-lactamase regulating signal transducer with metallopeptidase domain